MSKVEVRALQTAEFEGEVRSRLVDFLGTPPQLRGAVQTLEGFADREGVTVGLVSKLLRTDTGVRSALRSVALGGLFRVPRILEVLGDAAEGGSIRASEIYLDFVRKTLTDQQLLATVRPEESFEEMIDQAVSGARMLLEKAKGRKVTVGVSIEEGVSPAAAFRARGEFAVLDDSGVPKALREYETADIEGGVIDARVPTEAVVEELEEDVEKPLTYLEQWEQRREST